MAWERTNNVTDIVKEGDIIEVKYIGLDPKTKKPKVSRKALLPKPEGYIERPPREDKPRDNRRDDRRRDDKDRKPRN